MEKAMWHTFKFALLSASVLITLFAVLAILGAFKDYDLQSRIGAGLGIGLTAVVAISLMGLMFLSSRSHHDEDVHNAGRRK